LPDPDYDLFIIGGGINGCGIARDAAGRGLKVGLAEMGDLAQGTSSASTKLIHGGLRYLEHYEFSLVREALKERETLLAIAPQIVRPLRFVLPHGAGMRPAWVLRIGLILYDHLARRVSLPGSTRLNLRAHVAGEPLRDDLKTGFEYSDCSVDDARLVILNARDAARRGADILTRTRPVEMRSNGGHWQVTVQRDGGRERRFTAAAIVNAAGPWVDIVSGAIEDARHSPRVRLVQGAHIVVRKLFDHDRAYILQNTDGRIVFAIPYQGEFTLIGTTDTDFASDPIGARAKDTEIDYLLACVNRYFRRPSTRADVVWTFAGVRALAGTGEGNAQAASREYELALEICDGAPVLTVLGGKITSYRTLAEAVMKRLGAVFPDDERLPSPSWTGTAPLPGGKSLSAAVKDAAASMLDRHDWLTPQILDRWVAAYGTDFAQVCACFEQEGGPGRYFGAGLYEAEVRWLMRNEWAETADDIAWRRSKLGLFLQPAEFAALDDWMAQAR